MNDAYDLKSVNLPYMSGLPLRLLVHLLEGPLRGLLTPRLFRDAGVTKLRSLNVEDVPTMYPVYKSNDKSGSPPRIPTADWPAADSQTSPWPTVSDFADAYRSGRISPVEVAEKALAAIADSDQADPPLRAIIFTDREDVLRQAQACEERLKNGNPLSVLDGVPVAVKDELDMKPFPTRVGTQFLGTEPVSDDATVVARMRAAGALLIGKANMHEIGLGVTGMNPHNGPARNPYDPMHYTGGSSSGPAAAVAAGLCPIAIGADGGGSIRIPAAFCGVVGLKSTFGRVSEFGAAPLTWSMAHVGPLAGTATDAAIAWAAMAGPDPKDHMSQHQPAPTLDGWEIDNLEGIKIGVFWPWFRHATSEMTTACEHLLQRFEGLGATIHEIVLPELDAARVAHLVTIVSEMAQAQAHFYDKYHRQYGLDVRLSLALARQFTARDYVQSQRIRTRCMHHFGEALKQVHVIATPATGLSAPAIQKSALPDGDSDLTTLTEIMRFATPGNLTGLPAISFPAGYSDSGLPIGMQMMGRAWQEVLLLRFARLAEQFVSRREPRRVHCPVKSVVCT